MSDQLNLDEYTKKARVRMMIHAERAIEVLKDQLTTAKSSVRVAKLKSRIASYEEALIRLRSTDDQKENVQEK